MRDFINNWKLMWKTPVLYFWIVFSNLTPLYCLYENDPYLMEWDWFFVTNVFTFLIMPLAITVEDRIRAAQKT